MPAYHRLGQIPPKRHTQFRKPDGTLYSEELFGTEGFSGNYCQHLLPFSTDACEKSREIHARRA